MSQFFLGDPQSWKGPVVSYAGGAAALKADAEAAGIDLYVHSPYPINVASTNNRIRIPGRKLLQQHLHAAAEIGAKGVIVHGGHVLKDDDPDVGFDNWRKCIDGLDMPVPLLIENTAGGDNAMARRLERIDGLWEAIGACQGRRHRRVLPRHLPRPRRRQRAGHRGRPGAWRSPGGSTSCTPTTPATSSTPVPTGTPTSASGHIKGDDLVAVVREAGAPVVCETPGGAEGQGADIAWLREQVD